MQGFQGRSSTPPSPLPSLRLTLDLLCHPLSHSLMHSIIHYKNKGKGIHIRTNLMQWRRKSEIKHDEGKEERKVERNEGEPKCEKNWDATKKRNTTQTQHTLNKHIAKYIESQARPPKNMHCCNGYHCHWYIITININTVINITTNILLLLVLLLLWLFLLYS